MKNYLFPSKFKKLGWILLIPFIVLLLNPGQIILELPVLSMLNNNFFNGDVQWVTIIRKNIINDITCIGIIISLLLIAFSKEKNEDEYINKLRTNSLTWALLVNYSLLIIEILFIHGLSFLYVMSFNLFTILILYIIKFNISLYLSKKSILNSKK